MSKPLKIKAHRVVEGLSAASVSTGIPIDVLKRMKALGCDAFEPGNRIDPAKAKAWFSENSEKLKVQGEVLNLKDQKLNEEIRKLKRANDVSEGKLILATVHQSEIREMAQAVQGILIQMPSRLAPDLAGRAIPEIETRLQVAVDEVIGKLSRGEAK